MSNFLALTLYYTANKNNYNSILLSIYFYFLLKNGTSYLKDYKNV